MPKKDDITAGHGTTGYPCDTVVELFRLSGQHWKAIHAASTGRSSAANERSTRRVSPKTLRLLLGGIDKG